MLFAKPASNDRMSACDAVDGSHLPASRGQSAVVFDRSRMSASGYKQTFQGVSQNVRFTPESGHCQRKNGKDSESGHPMSAITPKADMRRGVSERPFYPRTRTSAAQERFGLKKRTLDVCLTPNSGRNWHWRWMSASDP